MEHPIRKTLAVTWDRLHDDTRHLAARLIQDRRRFDGIIAITRGGMVPAAILARELEIRLVDTLCIASYQDRQQGDLEVLKDVPGKGKGMLIVDDLSDTGATARMVRQMLPEAAAFVTVYVKPEGRDCVDIFISEVPQDCWILFPWDTAAQHVAPMALAAADRSRPDTVAD